ncbi:MAG: hypothetical protein ACT4OS_07960 [Acidimicrobiales bacterium]
MTTGTRRPQQLSLLPDLLHPISAAHTPTAAAPTNEEIGVFDEAARAAARRGLRQVRLALAAAPPPPAPDEPRRRAA